MQHQSQANWCWSAVATSVSIFYDPSSQWTQCLLANAQLGQSTCCNDGSTPQCNQAWYLDRALAGTGNFDHFASGAGSLQALEGEVNGGRVLGVRIGWAGGGGHFIILDGYDDPTQFVWVDDPWYGPSYISIGTLGGGYQGSGTWTDSYYTKS
jgi:hypothetical protein